jgi:uncharacterized damage-inducible protein DinB
MSTEVWLRGPVDGVPAVLQPVAHSLVQAQEDVAAIAPSLSIDALWTSRGAATPGFHVLHLCGALDRLFTYARGEQLTEAQLGRIASEGHPGTPPAPAADLLQDLDASVQRALAQVRVTRESALLEPRGVGRQQLASNVLGLLFHAAEHASRHAGQAITTARVVAGWADAR